jgi:hypothetical protein
MDSGSAPFARTRCVRRVGASRNDALEIARQASSPLLLKARGTPASSIVPALEKRARGTPDARLRPQPRVHGLSLDARASVTTKAPETPGVPHAMVFAACFVLSPAKSRNLSPSSPRYFRAPGLARERAVRISQDHTTCADAQSDANGAHLRSGSHRAAWSVPPRRRPLTRLRSLNGPPQEETVRAPGLRPKTLAPA